MTPDTGMSPCLELKLDTGKLQHTVREVLETMDEYRERKDVEDFLEEPMHVHELEVLPESCFSGSLAKLLGLYREQVQYPVDIAYNEYGCIKKSLPAGRTGGRRP